MRSWLLTFALAALGCQSRAVSQDVVTADVLDVVTLAQSVQDGSQSGFWCHYEGAQVSCFYGANALTQCQDDPARPNESACSPF